LIKTRQINNVEFIAQLRQSIFIPASIMNDKKVYDLCGDTSFNVTRMRIFYDNVLGLPYR